MCKGMDADDDDSIVVMMMMIVSRASRGFRGLAAADREKDFWSSFVGYSNTTYCEACNRN